MQVIILLQLISACAGIIGSLFFAKGIMRQSTEAMAKLSGTYFNSNPHMPPALAAQKADYLFGGGLIVTAFTLQFISFFLPSTWSVFSSKAASAAPWVALGFTLIAFFACRRLSRRLARHYEQQIESWLKAHDHE